MKSTPTNNEAGFTLIELMVSLSIFTIIVGMVGVGLFSVIDASARAQGLTEAVNNLNFVMDDMARRMRTGYDFNCGSLGGEDCENGGTSLYFTGSRVQPTSGDDPEYRYFLDDGRIMRGDHSGNASPITSDSLEIENLEFYVYGTESGIDAEQSRVQVVLTGSAGGGSNEQTFSVQTTITQRLLYSPS